MNVWRCTKCNTTQGGMNKPLLGVCSKGGAHRWTSVNLSAKPSLYQCGKCGTVTSSQGRPLQRRCNKGGNCSWRKYQ